MKDAMSASVIYLPLTRLVRRERLVAFGKPFEIGLIVVVGWVEGNE
jgi:hypothetical protein